MHKITALMLLCVILAIVYLAVGMYDTANLWVATCFIVYVAWDRRR